MRDFDPGYLPIADASNRRNHVEDSLLEEEVLAS